MAGSMLYAYIGHGKMAASRSLARVAKVLSEHGGTTSFSVHEFNNLTGLPTGVRYSGYMLVRAWRKQQHTGQGTLTELYEEECAPDPAFEKRFKGDMT